ncbi:MAG: zf-HC2 domain-containing protein [Acidobacteria bacterium]|nr:zf-HC2 domain-containing protein [Acidobacteriota bacterium]
MLDCRHVLAELSNYLDGEVSPKLKQTVEEHLASCRRCSLVYNTTRKTLKLVTEAGALEIPLEVSARLRVRLNLGKTEQNTSGR